MIREIVTKVDRIPERALLISNMVFALFVGFAHGGALAISYLHPDSESESIQLVARISLPLVVIVLGSSVIGFFSERRRLMTLRMQALIIVLGNIAGTMWAASLLINGFPRGSFGWTPGMLTALFVYSIYLFRRSWLSDSIDRSILVRYMHLMAIPIVLPIDVAVFLKFMAYMATHGFIN